MKRSTLIEVDLIIKIIKQNIGFENKLTRFRNCPETEVACKYPKTFFKTQISEIFVEYEKGFDMKTGKININSAQPYQNGKDQRSYIPVTFYKKKEIIKCYWDTILIR